MSLYSSTQNAMAGNIGLKPYSPSILIITDNPTSTFRLRQTLENQSCQVYQINVNLESLLDAKQKYYDVVVLKIEKLSQKVAKIIQLFKTDGELAALPKVILARPGKFFDITTDFKLPAPVYHLFGAADSETKLLQIVEQVCYMVHRYI